MSNYTNSSIYTIRFFDNNKLIYISSTTQSLSVRFAGHKKNISSPFCKYVIRHYNGNFDCCYIELLEFFECNNKQELKKKENEIIRKYEESNNYIVINNMYKKQFQKVGYYEYSEDYSKSGL